MSSFDHVVRGLVAVTLTGSVGVAFAQPVPEPDVPTPENPTPGTPGTPDTPDAPIPPTDTPTPPTPTTTDPIDRSTTTDPVPSQTYAPTYAPTYVEPARPAQTSREESTLERYGVAVALGGGVSGFTNDTLRETTDDGGNWGVRLAIGTRMPIGFEAAYIGSAQGIDALGLDNDAVLVGNGLQGNLRVNLIDANIQPFLFGGVAWRRYSLANSNENTSDILDSDDVLEVPVGAGIAFKYRGVMLDARGEFRYADQEDLVPEFADDGALDGTGTMHRYGVNLNAGIAF